MQIERSILEHDENGNSKCKLLISFMNKYLKYIGDI